MDIYGWAALFALIFVLKALHDRRKMQRRAAYNREIGQPDLAAPLPSEAYAVQVRQRRSGSTIVTLLVILILLVVFGPLLLKVFFGTLLLAH